MITDLAKLTLDELSKVIDDAQKVLADRQKSERKATLAKIHELAADAGKKIEEFLI